MQSKATTPEAYIKSLPPDRKAAVSELRKVILKNLPKGFVEVMSYGMLGYVIPHSIYPKGYHANPKMPLGYMNVGSQKNYIAVHHLGVYASKELLNWFTTEYSKQCKSKLDMGKGCIRLKKMDQIPYKLIGELAKKISAKEWIEIYEKNMKR